MSEPVLLLDHKFRPAYIGFGEFSQLSALMNFGSSAKADRFFLKMQNFLPRKKVPATPIFERLLRSQTLKGHDALLHYTGDLSDTGFTGLMEQGGEIKSVRILKQPEDMMFHIHQSQFVQNFFNGPFIMTPFMQVDEVILASSFIPAQRNIEKSDHIEEKIVHLNDMFQKKYFRRKNAREFVPLDMKVLFFTAGFQDLFEKIDVWVGQQNASFPIIPVHGKFTEDSLYVSAEEKIVLVDYERAGWHIAYYDYFHYILQKISLREKTPSLSGIRFNIEMERERLNVFLAFYLIDQLYHDLGDYYQKNYQYPELAQAIKNKSQWLEQLI